MGKSSRACNADELILPEAKLIHLFIKLISIHSAELCMLNNVNQVGFLNWEKFLLIKDQIRWLHLQNTHKDI